MKINKTLFTITLLAFSVQLMAQNLFSGTVIDAEDNTPLIGASVFIKELSKGTITDINGNFTLDVLSGNYTIEVSYIGYNSIVEQIALLKTPIVKKFRLNPSAENLGEVVVSAKGIIQQTREQPFQVNVLDTKPLQAQSQPVNGLVNQISGVRVREDGGMGSNANIMLNGIGGKGVRIFIDGIPADLLGSGMAMNNLPINMIDHIEVYKGIIPSKFGSDALGGVLNLVTRDTKKDYFDMSTGIGSFGTFQVNLNSRKYIGKENKFYIGANGFYKHSDNDYWMDDVDILTDNVNHNAQTGRTRRFNDAYTSYLGKLTLGSRRLKWADDLQLNLISSHVYKEWQHGVIVEHPWGETFSEQSNFNSELRWKKYGFFNGKLDIMCNIGYNYIDFYFEDIAAKTYYWGAANGIDNYVEKSTIGESGYFSNGRNPQYDKHNMFARLNLFYHLNKNHKLNFTALANQSNLKGHDYRGIETFGEDILANPQSIKKQYLGLSLESHLLKGLLTNITSVKNYSGISKVEVIDAAYRANGQQKNDYNSIGYGDALKIQLRPNVGATVSYEYTLRVPDEEELFGDYISVYPNATIKPEKSHNIDIGIRYNSTKHIWSARINGFFRRSSDLIFLNAVSALRSVYMNLESTETIGTEGEITINPNNNIGIFTNLTYQNIRLKEVGDNGNIPERYINARIPNTPWMFGNAGITYTLPWHFGQTDKLQWYYTCNYTHEFFLSWEVDGKKDTKASIPQQFIHNSGISYSFNKDHISLNIESKNFTDEKSYDNYKIQKPGRSFYVKLRVFLEK